MLSQIVAKSMGRVVTSIVTERMVIQIVLEILIWLSKKTTNDLDDSLVEVISTHLNKNEGSHD
jgi:hypothetical protein